MNLNSNKLYIKKPKQKINISFCLDASIQYPLNVYIFHLSGLVGFLLFAIFQEFVRTVHKSNVKMTRFMSVRNLRGINL